MKFPIMMLCIALSLLISVGPAGAQEEVKYRIKPGDQLNVYVHENPDLTMTAAVLADGTISYPLVGSLYVEGLSTSGLQNVLTEKLKQYLQMPVVVVTISTLTVHKVYIMGEVTAPGEYPYQMDKRLTEYLALAGGISPEANLKKCNIYEKDSDQARQVINLKEILEKNNQALNITLKPEDTVFLERRSGFVLGEWVEIAQIFGILVASATLYIFLTRE